MKLHIAHANIYLHDPAQLDRIEALLTTLHTQGELIVKQLEELQAELEGVKTDAQAERVEVATKIQSLTDELAALKDQLAAGTPVTEADMTGLIAKAKEARAAVKGIFEAAPQIPPLA